MRSEDSNWFAKCEEEIPSPEELIPLITPNLAIAFDLQPTQANSSAEEEEQARTLKRPRLVWTFELHKRFVDAVVHLGIKNAVPKTIMQLMSVDGITRENVASHLQKYRLYLNRMNSGDGGGGNVGGSDHLFLSSNHFMSSFVSVPILQQQEQIAAAHPHHQFLHGQISAANFISPTNGNQQQQVVKDLESGAKTVLTLFPTRDD